MSVIVATASVRWERTWRIIAARFPPACVAAFSPRAVRPLPISERHLDYHWDGDRIDRWFDHSTGRWTVVAG